ncbi:unnamed protein product [Somion occarium]|uniref:Transcription regulator Rua1 C-terminal domain-containing protein n=1 Tax=Somion occarium TaxID=3059160 RepID=A0ABP1D678_9APHY
MDHAKSFSEDVYDIQRELTFISPSSHPLMGSIVHENNDWTVGHFQSSSLHGISPYDGNRSRPIRSYTSLLAADALLNLAGSSPQSPFFPSPPSQAHTHTPQSTLFPNSPSDHLKMTEQFPGTPLHHLFSSSPAYWNLGVSSVSPIIRTTSSPHRASQSTNSVGSSTVYSRSRKLSSASRLQFAYAMDDTLSPLTNISSAMSTPSSAADVAPPLPRGRQKTRGDATATTDSNTIGYNDSPAYTDSPSPRRSARNTRTRTSRTSVPPRAPQPSSTAMARPTASSVKRKASSSRGGNSKRSRVEPESNSAPAGASSNLSDDDQEDHSDDSDGDSPEGYPMRTFPSNVEINPDFPLLYRKFHISSFREGENRKSGLAGSTWNEPRDAFDLYTPRYVKGRGNTKVGLCPICCESVKRGGAGKKLWLSMKFSAFNYHMQYSHGISPLSKAPFSPPVAFQLTDQPSALKNQKTKILKGKCHKCQKWVPVEGPKEVETKWLNTLS